MTEPLLNCPVDRIPLSALKGEAASSRRQADLYRQAAAREDLLVALFEAEIARRATSN